MAAVAPEQQADGLTSRMRAAQAQLASSVVRAGLKDDPYAHIIEAQGAVIGVLADAVAEVRTVRQPQPAPFTDQQVTEFGRRFAMIGHQEVASIVRNEFRRTWALLLAGVLSAIVIGLGAGWLLWGRGPTLTCADQQGGRLCYVWTTPPTETARGAPR